MESISTHIDRRGPDIYIGETVESIWVPYDKDKVSTVAERRFVHTYKARIDHILRGLTVEGRPIGLELKHGCHTIVIRLKASSF